MLKKILIALFLLNSILFANNTPTKSVVVSATINRADFQGKTIKNLEKKALEKAKLKAAEKLFGEVIASKTFRENNALLKEYIYSAKGGVLHIKGNPKFENGKKLGDIKVTIKAYATPKDINNMSIHKIYLKDFVYANDNLNIKQLKTAAKDAFIVEAISKKRPSIKTEANKVEIAKKLALTVKINKMDFDIDTASFKMSGFVEYIPAFIQNDKIVSKTQSINPTKSNFKIIKNKALVVVNSTDGEQKEFEINYSNHGIILPKKVMDYINRKNINHYVITTIKAKLKVPDSIKSNSIVIKNNGKGRYNYQDYISYNVTINGEGNFEQPNQTYSVKIINDNGLKYVNLNILVIADKGWANDEHYLSNVIGNLKKLTFSIDDSDKKFSVIRVINNNSSSIVVNSTNGKEKEFKFNYSNNGIILPKKVTNYINRENINYLITTIYVKLKVPDAIKTNTIIVKNNGKSRYNYQDYISYNATINGQGNFEQPNQTFSVEVINDNGLRYVNLIIMIKTDKNWAKEWRYLYNIIGKLSQLSFIATDSDDGEKWYALNPIKHFNKQKCPLVIKDNNEKVLSKTHNMIYNGISYIFDKKTFRYIYAESNTKDIRTYLKLKLKVPNAIKTDAIIIKNNGKSRYNYQDYISYNATINGQGNTEEPNQTFSVKIINNNGLRYINLTIAIRIDKEWAKGWRYLYNLIANLNQLTFIATDSDDGEKWYALHPVGYKLFR